jgi:L-amino acid N-acyltransferase YncA
MDLSIRAVKEEDAGSIIELLNPIIEAGKYTIMDEPFSVNDQLDFIRGFPERGVYNVAVSDDTRRVIGIQDVQPISTEVNALRHVGEISTFVSLALPREGIGRSLSLVTFKEARKLGFLKLTAIIRADNPNAFAFYRSLGFKPTGTARKHVCIRGKYIDEVFMERFLESD